jgi:hypothetical protein
MRFERCERRLPLRAANERAIRGQTQSYEMIPGAATVLVDETLALVTDDTLATHGLS